METSTHLFSDLAPQKGITVDLFAGGGGASDGIGRATGRDPDIAINHDAQAVSLHKANHPHTKHYVSDVFTVDPREATKGQPVALLWASPDCTHHSKARGAAPNRDKKRRALAWVVTRWAGQVRPSVIMLENVQEFADWGPLVGPIGNRQPDPRHKGRTFRHWVSSLERLGYVVEWRLMNAAEYGAPTSRVRLFVIARCDGLAITWPKPTHGEGLKPFRTAAECIDWDEPMCSIFATKTEAKEWGKANGKHTPRRPLADKTMARVARGIRKFVVENPRPFLVGVGGRKGQSAETTVDRPFHTITAKGDTAIVAPVFVPRYGEREGQKPRALRVDQPSPVIVPTGNGASLVSAFLARHWGGMTGTEIDKPFPTVTTKGCQDQIVTAHIQRDFGTSTGHKIDEPLATITSDGGGKAALVLAFLMKYYGQGTGQDIDQPAHTLTTKERLALVTVIVDGEPYIIVDICMRMLTPRELYRCQGFKDDFIIDQGVPLDSDEQLGLSLWNEATTVPLTKTAQVRMVGNSVPPDMAHVLALHNAPADILRQEAVA